MGIQSYCPLPPYTPCRVRPPSPSPFKDFPTILSYILHLGLGRLCESQVWAYSMGPIQAGQKEVKFDQYGRGWFGV